MVKVKIKTNRAVPTALADLIIFILVVFKKFKRRSFPDLDVRASPVSH